MKNTSETKPLRLLSTSAGEEVTQENYARVDKYIRDLSKEFRISVPLVTLIYETIGGNASFHISSDRAHDLMTYGLADLFDSFNGG